MKAKDYLNQLIKLNKMIANKMVERDQWFAMATSITAPFAPETGVRVQTSGNQQKMTSAADRYIDIEREIDACIDRLHTEKQKIIKVIEQLEVTEYDVLHKMYVGILEDDKTHYFTFNEIADIYDKSYSWATTIHGIALRNVQKIIDSEQNK